MVKDAGLWITHSTVNNRETPPRSPDNGEKWQRRETASSSAMLFLLALPHWDFHWWSQLTLSATRHISVNCWLSWHHHTISQTQRGQTFTSVSFWSAWRTKTCYQATLVYRDHFFTHFKLKYSSPCACLNIFSVSGPSPTVRCVYLPLVLTLSL